MAFTRTWDKTVPVGTEQANTIDDQMRNAKQDIEERMLIEHEFSANANDGKHKANSARINQGTHAAIPAAATAGKVYAETDTKKAYFDTGTAWSFLATMVHMACNINAGDVREQSNFHIELGSATSGDAVTFKTAFTAAADYTVVGTITAKTTGGDVIVSSKATTGFTITTGASDTIDWIAIGY